MTMSDESTDATLSPVSINTTLAYSDAREIQLRQVYLGLSPAIYITPEVDGDEVSFNVYACDLELDDLVQVLDLLARNIGNSRELPPDPEADDEEDPEDPEDIWES